jgi:3-hydroxy acid dehydrogenase / malonic semialdehyde reductase
MCDGTEFSLVRFGGDAGKAAAVYDGMEALGADDIADVVTWVAGQPPHVNVNTIELMPTAQSFAAFQVDRRLA